MKKVSNAEAEPEIIFNEDHLKRLSGLRLMDDDFMTKVFDGHLECVQLVLQIIMNQDDLTVIDAKPQVFIENLKNRSVRFDILAVDSLNRRYDVEIQRADAGAGRKRARYNSSMLDNNTLDKGADFNALTETYVIFITENDVLKHGLPIYHIERRIEETNELFDDGEHILYVNGKYRDQTPIGKLMHDFSCTNPDDMNYSLLADRARYFKESQKGREIMCKAFEELLEQGEKKGVKQTKIADIKALMEALNLSVDQAMDILKVNADLRDELRKIILAA